MFVPWSSWTTRARGLIVGAAVAGALVGLLGLPGFRTSAAPTSAAIAASATPASSWPASSWPASASIAASPAQNPSESVDLVVDFGDGRAAVYRHPWSPALTGLLLLTESELMTAGSSGAVCRIGSVGCPESDCFCACAGAEDCTFWGYHFLGEDGWNTAEVGAAERTLAAGDADGWVWSGARSPFTATAATRGVLLAGEWLAGQVAANGSVGGHAGLTAEWVVAARAAGLEPGEPTRAFLRSSAAAYSQEGAAQAGKLAVAASALTSDPRDFGGVDLVDRVNSHLDPATGQIGRSNWDQAWGILGLAAARVPIPPAAVEFLAASASPQGWGVMPGSPADPDSTGLALQAMAAAGADDHTVVTQAVEHLRTTQATSGGWAHDIGGDANANSTAYAVQGLLAVGEDPLSSLWAAGPGGPTPLDYLLGVQLVDGRIQHDVAPADLVATLQAVPALAGRDFSLPGPGAASRAAADWVFDQQQADGSFDGLFNPAATIEAVLALAAAGHHANPVSGEGETPVDYLTSVASDYAAQGPASAGALTLAAIALGQDPRDFGGVDLVGTLLGSVNADGAFGDGGTWSNAYGLLGLAAAGETPPPAAITHLAEGQAPEGGWGFEHQADEATADSTGIALQALAASGVPSDSVAVRSGVVALFRLQRHDGGFPGSDRDTGVASTPIALTGLRSAGQMAIGPGWMRTGTDGVRRSAVDAILAHQSADGGFAGLGGPNDPSSTYAALFSLSGGRLPIRSPLSVYLPLTVNQY